MAEERAIEVGDRFETRDKRDAGRTVEVIAAYEDTYGATRQERAERMAPAWGLTVDEVFKWMREGETFFRIQTEAHPKNPDAVGTIRRISERTLRTKYTRVSR